VAEPFRMPRVKVCGVRTPDVALAVARAGGDAIGLVEHRPSLRHLEPREAAALIEALPAGLSSILVVVDATPESLERSARAAGVNAVQLCGDERARDWTSFPLPILRRIAVQRGAERELEDWVGVAAGFVLDHPASAGGTGRSVDLELATQLAARAHCLLAGGLDGSNVAACVERVRPVGVDASSRLESAPGVKDLERVDAFVRAARAALAEVPA